MASFQESDINENVKVSAIPLCHAQERKEKIDFSGFDDKKPKKKIFELKTLNPHPISHSDDII